MQTLLRFHTASTAGGFRDPDYWIWCGSPIADASGRFHLFASRWPRSLPFFSGYKISSEIVRAESDRPEGPYRFCEVVLPDRGSDYWDGRMTHNPTVVKYQDQYLLFYIGATFDGQRPEADELVPDHPIGEPDPQPTEGVHYSDAPARCYASIRIGCAVATDLRGPWERPDAPCLAPLPGRWDSTVVTNPAVVVNQTGEIQLYYRSNTPEGLRIGLARSRALGEPFERVGSRPVLSLPGGNHVEDPFVWLDATGAYRMIAKDMTGGITGELHAGAHLISSDGVSWRVGEPPRAYGRRVGWDDGTETEQGHLERPELLFADPDRPQTPTHLFAATTVGKPGTWQSEASWNVVLPISGLD